MKPKSVDKPKAAGYYWVKVAYPSRNNNGDASWAKPTVTDWVIAYIHPGPNGDYPVQLFGGQDSQFQWDRERFVCNQRVVVKLSGPIPTPDKLGE